MKKVYITHATDKYLPVAHNLATSIRAFSDIPVVVYCVDVKQKDTYIFQNAPTYFEELMNKIALYKWLKCQPLTFILYVT